MPEPQEFQIVTLTTDFGYDDPYVAELKASIYTKAKEVHFVDISHAIQTYDIVKAAFFVSNVYDRFPKGTIHIIAVHNHYSRNNRILVIQRFGHYFVAPDNGVMSLIFNDLKIGEIYTVDEAALALSSIEGVMSHMVGYVKHRLPIDEIGPRVDRINKKLQLEAVITDDQIRATIIHIDHYENVIINVNRKKFEDVRKGRNFELYYKQNDPIDHLSRKYADAPVGEVLCRFNSDDYLEIAINMGKASSMLNLHRNETVQINFYE